MLGPLSFIFLLRVITLNTIRLRKRFLMRHRKPEITRGLQVPKKTIRKRGLVVGPKSGLVTFRTQNRSHQSTNTSRQTSRRHLGFCIIPINWERTWGTNLARTSLWASSRTPRAQDPNSPNREFYTDPGYKRPNASSTPWIIRTDCRTF